MSLSASFAAAAAVVAPGSGPLPAPKPGVYENVPADVYHRWDAVSNSRLTLLDRSPAHLKASLTYPQPETPAQRLGQITHMAVLEPASWEKTYALAARCTATKKDKDQCGNTGTELTPEGWRCGVHGGTRATGVLSQDDYDLCLGVVASFARHRAGALLSGVGHNELSIVWLDPETGLTCKARLDRISPLVAGGTIVDLKSTRDARMRPFAKAIYQYGYHRQGAMYVPGAQAVGLSVEHYVICPFEKEPPYPVAAYRLDDGAMSAGEVEVRRLMRLYAECLATDTWPTTPSYPSTIEDISIPSWAFAMIDTGTEFGV